jgi:hypothetical protein
MGINKKLFHAFNVKIYAAIFMISLLDKLLSIKVHHALNATAGISLFTPLTISISAACAFIIYWMNHNENEKKKELSVSLMA